jgi:sorbitol-specific phosphotransferase system component IIBC
VCACTVAGSIEVLELVARTFAKRLNMRMTVVSGSSSLLLSLALVCAAAAAGTIAGPGAALAKVISGFNALNCMPDLSCSAMWTVAARMHGAAAAGQAVNPTFCAESHTSMC